MIKKNNKIKRNVRNDNPKIHLTFKAHREAFVFTIIGLNPVIFKLSGYPRTDLIN